MHGYQDIAASIFQILPFRSILLINNLVSVRISRYACTEEQLSIRSDNEEVIVSSAVG